MLGIKKALLDHYYTEIRRNTKKKEKNNQQSKRLQLKLLEKLVKY